MRFLLRLFRSRKDEDKEEKAGDAPSQPKPWKLTPIEARTRAKMMVASAKKLGVELDYSPASLEKVDFLIDKERETGVGATKEMQQVLISLGAYTGEVIVRELDGIWALSETQPVQDPLVVVVGGKYAVNVISAIVRRFVMGEPHGAVRTFEECKKLAAV